MYRHASLLALLFALPAPAAEPFRQNLSGTPHRVEVKSRDVTPGSPVAWRVTKYNLVGGKQEGVELVEIDNGRLKIVVVPTRGMGVLSVHGTDVRLGWDSPVTEVVHPKFVNLQERGGLGWLSGFNEWMVRCGLESNGQAGPDKFVNNVGDEATMELTLHGKIANIPASSYELVVDREPPYRLRLRGTVHERMFYGPKLELQTELSTEPGSNTFRIADVVTNRGGQPQEFQLLYHPNYGRPLLEEGSTFVAPARRVTPFNANAAKDVATYDTYKGPNAGYIEQVYLFRLYADKDERTTVMLQNRARSRAVTMAFSLKELPYLTLWKNTAAVEDGYVTGIEPGTNYPNHRRVERKAGRVPKLAPGASYAAAVDYAVLVGPDEVARAAERIDAIRNGRKTQVDEQPEKAE